MKVPTIYVLSDSLGETAENVARATISQFDKEDIDIIRVPYIRTIEQVEDAVREAQANEGIICHTIVSEELRSSFEEIAHQYKVTSVDIMGPMLRAVETIAGTKPRMQPGMVHKLDQEYFKKVEAIEFAVKYDDGKNPAGFLKADIVIIGVSRTSKTPLSMYLAHKKIKAANLPLVPEVPLPEELFQLPSYKIVGLIIDPGKLNTIRSERLKSMGLADGASYAALDRIREELTYAREIMRKLHCPVIDVSTKAIEETANRVMEIIERNRRLHG
ncbi:MAG: pyruvate, water dikinase regulatory protein [Negativicoccus succinicivorans]|nr:pyruvate, water dikinase regulatory protein [Negativicoccus succinicivorans]